MPFRLSRLMSAASASYGVFALTKPRHLGNALSRDPVRQADYDALALTYGVRDLTVSALGLLGRSERTVTTAMVLRILCDVTDAAVLGTRAGDRRARRLVLGVTLGWAALNAAALLLDRRSESAVSRPAG
jgi:hypothetical protein